LPCLISIHGSYLTYLPTTLFLFAAELMADNHEDRIAAEVAQLQVDVKRLGTEQANGFYSVPFGVLFDDEAVSNYYEALVGTLKAAKVSARSLRAKVAEPPFPKFRPSSLRTHRRLSPRLAFKNLTLSSPLLSSPLLSFPLLSSPFLPPRSAGF
jgi:hypothetical protein